MIRGGELVHSVLHYFPFIGGDVVLAVQDAEPRPGVDVVGDHVATRNVEQVDRPTGHLRELGQPLQRIVV
jgi:hypothetical protein